MDIIQVIVSLVSIGILALSGIFLIVGVLVLIYLMLTGKRWD